MEREPLASLAATLSDIYSGSDQKAGKIFAMGLYQGLTSYAGDDQDHRIGQIIAASDTLAGHIDLLVEASSDEASLANVSRDIRKQIGSIDRPSAAYLGEHSLLPSMHAIITRNKLIGNNFRDLGLSLVERLETLPIAKGDSKRGIFLREYEAIDRYLNAGDVK